MAIHSPFRLYILGQLPPETYLGSLESRLRSYVQGNSTTLSVKVQTPDTCQLSDYVELVMLATFGNAQAVHTIYLDTSQQARLSQKIRELRGSIESADPPIDSQALKDFGGELFDMILQKSVRTLFEKATDQAHLLPFEILVQDHRIAGWPWEYLWDSQSDTFICQEFHPVSRVIFNPTPSKGGHEAKPRIHLLVIFGTRWNDQVAPPSSQKKAIEESLRDNVAQDSVTLEVVAEMTPDDILKELDKREYDIVHYYGHAGFDHERNQGYLRLDQPDGSSRRWYANQFASSLAARGIRLTFLNACNTGRGDPNIAPSRSSLAAALLGRGIPAVIATQYEMPVPTAHLFASQTYNTLALGKPLVEAMTRGRQAIDLRQSGGKFLDWGIPVLYAIDPTAVVFPRPKDQQPKPWEQDFETDLSTRNPIKALRAPQIPGGPTVAVEQTIQSLEEQDPIMKVAIVDLNARVGFLPELIVKANQAQRYYGFEVVKLPIPVGSMNGASTEEGEPCQLFLHRVESYLRFAAQQLDVQCVCYLTSCMIAGEENNVTFSNRFFGLLGGSGDVFAISTYDFAKYARKANVSFAKATLYLCLAVLIATDQSNQAGFHDEIVGCPLDNWQSREDFLKGLEIVRFNHSSCREKIKDQEQQDAIDRLLALQMEWSL